MKQDSSFQRQRVVVWINLILVALFGHSTTGWTSIVQLVRNFLCCLKDLSLFDNTFLYNPFLLDITPPLHKTTWLEFLISTTQLYACISVTRSGALMLNSSLGKLRRVGKLLQLQSNNTGPRTPRASNTLATASSIVKEHMIKEQSSARRTVVISACLLIIGTAFIWLFAHSWHVSETDWIGGVDALIHALTRMEIALVVLLYIMFDDALAMFVKSKRMMAFVKVLKQDTLEADIIDAERYAWMADGDWTPFWAADVAVFPAKAREDRAELKMLNSEISKIAQDVASLVQDSGEEEEEKKGSRKGRRGSRSRSRSRSRGRRKSSGLEVHDRLAAVAERLDADISTLRMTGVREFVFFVLNFAAFYGYMLCIIAYHWRASDENQPAYITAIKFGMTNADADWRGNFVGDLMWTIEPVVAMVSPAVMSALKPTVMKAKVKMD